MTEVVPVMLLVGAIAGVVSFGIVQSLARIFPRGREAVVITRIDARPQRMRTATLQ
jgi:hypothetical protein